MKLSPSQPAVFHTRPASTYNTEVSNLINNAVLQLLEVEFATRMFDKPLTDLGKLGSTLCTQTHRDINRNMS